MTSVANVRETPYLKSSQVTALPSSHLTPSLSVNFQVLAPSSTVPVSVARSGIGVVGLLGVGRDRERHQAAVDQPAEVRTSRRRGRCAAGPCARTGVGQCSRASRPWPPALRAAPAAAVGCRRHSGQATAMRRCSRDCERPLLDSWPLPLLLMCVAPKLGGTFGNAALPKTGGGVLPVGLGVEGVAEAVAEQVEADDDDRDQEGRGEEEREVRRRVVDRVLRMLPSVGVGGLMPTPR